MNLIGSVGETSLCHRSFHSRKDIIDQFETASLVMSLRWKSRSRCVDWMEIGGLQVGFRALLLTVYLLQGGEVSTRQHNHSMQETRGKLIGNISN